jgi:hypothetical protein
VNNFCNRSLARSERDHTCARIVLQFSQRRTKPGAFQTQSNIEPIFAKKSIAENCPQNDLRCIFIFLRRKSNLGRAPSCGKERESISSVCIRCTKKASAHGSLALDNTKRLDFLARSSQPSACTCSSKAFARDASLLRLHRALHSLLGTRAALPTLRGRSRACRRCSLHFLRGVAPRESARESLILAQNQHRHAADIDARHTYTPSKHRE